MIKGGRWIASFDVAIRDFDIATTLKKKATFDQKKKFDALIFGGVRNKGFVLSKAFAFMASPTYRVGCSVIYLEKAPSIKWSTLVENIRDATTVMSAMEFEWMWLLFFGEGNLISKVEKGITTYKSRTLGLLYADLKNKVIINSNTFISRHGAKLFNPINLDKKYSSFKFWVKK
ncbi:MAG: hypothetical protein EAX86_04060 [Candidatus Heimdallarchaeota archaeon]|nr:hypothetical protein [Candidatus Heimdallarchaeota archaeon]